ncbi:MAG: carboxypeptidase regulatory-like domain-containing protein [SAR324 cluster bacterium]|uniref:Carboxypeptidase regulatory-like domain-containing protein n=1 Tax=SAR324 cluster bacterium TaxID=2024889 RepID=A0A7X9FU35_9DELT|nr:carboxypeptidase regulatory-like domain-containing protein [SAR324 cluster bacterium]
MRLNSERGGYKGFVLNHTFSVILFFLGTLSILMLGACGGGTTGTGDIGGQSIKSVSGTIYDTKGAPFENAELQIQETGNSVTSDNNGKFDFSTNLTENTINLRVSRGDFDAVVQIDGLQDKGSQLVLQLVVNLETEQLSVESIQFIVDEGTEDPEKEDAAQTPPEESQPSNPVKAPEQSVLISGIVLKSDGDAFSGVQVTFVEGDAQSSTNINGEFLLEGSTSERRITLRLKKGIYSGKLVIRDIPAAKNLKVRLKILTSPRIDLNGKPVLNSDDNLSVVAREIEFKKL